LEEGERRGEGGTRKVRLALRDYEEGENRRTAKMSKFDWVYRVSKKGVVKKVINIISPGGKKAWARQIGVSLIGMQAEGCSRCSMGLGGKKKEFKERQTFH